MIVRTRRGLRAAAVALSLGLALTACAQASSPATEEGDAPVGEQTGSSGPGTETALQLTGELRIYAAASLRAGFDELATAMEEQHPRLDVVPIVYDGSSTLATQIQEGAPVDVFASADENNMSKVESLVVSPEIFATNTLVIAVPAGNPADVTSIADLADVATVLCAPEVPCGAASRDLLALDGVAVEPVSMEQNVTAVLTKVATGDAEAGLVYATDAAAEPAVEAIVPDRADDVVNRYPIAALADAPNPDAARAFIELVTGATGQDILASLGFGRP